MTRRCGSALTVWCKYPLLISIVWVLLLAVVICVQCDALRSGRTRAVYLAYVTVVVVAPLSSNSGRSSYSLFSSIRVGDIDSILGVAVDNSSV